jgi:hypothetical protein
MRSSLRVFATFCTAVMIGVLVAWGAIVLLVGIDLWLQRRKRR